MDVHIPTKVYYKSTEKVRQDNMQACKYTNRSKFKVREHIRRFCGDKGMYQSPIDGLIYLSHTRPNVAFVVSLVS